MMCSVVVASWHVFQSDLDFCTGRVQSCGWNRVVVKLFLGACHQQEIRLVSSSHWETFHGAASVWHKSVGLEMINWKC